ncbi:MAG TPA: 50S ribosomal protein L15 [Patescibacteria group bacterium]|nr:50S ribosomal protein L15 [Patescibacteria group bacterium]
MFNLHTLKPKFGSRKKKIIVGRGNASGRGTYSTRGVKGQKARTGGTKGLKRLGMKFLLAQTPKLGGFRGLGMPMSAINLTDLEKMFKDGEVATPRLIMMKKRLSSGSNGVKILGKGKLTKKLEVRAHDFSISARKAITELGGKAVIIPISKQR